MKKFLLLWLFTILLIACSRRSGKDSFEATTEILLPTGITVIHDIQQHEGNNYFHRYAIQLDADSSRQVEQQIKSSKYYSGGNAQILYDCIWYKEKDLYKFEGKSFGDALCEATFDPATGLLNYLEYSRNRRM